MTTPKRTGESGSISDRPDLSRQTLLGVLGITAAAVVSAFLSGLYAPPQRRAPVTPTASKADRWLAIRPGTDMALALALTHHLCSQALHDEDFCRDWLLGWERWRDFMIESDAGPRGRDAAAIALAAAPMGAHADGERRGSGGLDTLSGGGNDCFWPIRG